MQLWFRNLRSEYNATGPLENLAPLRFEYNTSMGEMGSTWFSAHLEQTGKSPEGIHVVLFHDKEGALTARLHMVPVSRKRPVLTYDVNTENGSTQITAGKKKLVERFHLTEAKKQVIQAQMHEILKELLHQEFNADARQQQMLTV